MINIKHRMKLMSSEDKTINSMHQISSVKKEPVTTYASPMAGLTGA